MNDLRISRPRTLSKAYLFASGKGGSGKSTLCAGVAAALALSGKRVIAWDADLLMRNLDIYTGLYENALFDLSDVLEGRKTPGAALTPHPEIPGLSLLAAPAKRIAPSPEDMRRVAGELLPLRLSSGGRAGGDRRLVPPRGRGGGPGGHRVHR